MRLLRQDKDRRGSKREVEAFIVTNWLKYYNHRLAWAEPLDNPLDLLRAAVIDVKYMLRNDMQNVLGDYDISCACVMGTPFMLYVDITPKDKQCSASLPSLLLH